MVDWENVWLLRLVAKFLLQPGCKKECEMNPSCVGVEYSGGRCEIWTRREGIESAVVLNGFKCLHYLWLGSVGLILEILLPMVPGLQHPTAYHPNLKLTSWTSQTGYFPKQLQLMGLLILAKKKTLFQHDFQVCLSSWFPGLSPLCLPSTGSSSVMISRFVSLCLALLLDPVSSWFRVVSLCPPSTGSCFVMISRFVSLCLALLLDPVSSWFRVVSLCLPSTGSCFVMISRFVSLCLALLLDPVSSWFPGLSPFVSRFYWILFRHDFELSPFVSLLLDPVSSWFPGLSPCVSLLLDPVSSWFPGLSPCVSLLLDPVSSWFRVVSLCLRSTGSSSVMVSSLVFLWFPLSLFYFPGAENKIYHNSEACLFLFPAKFLAGDMI